IGNDNPDNIYLNSNVSGLYEYRITGTRGTMPYLSFGTKSGGYERDGTMVPTGKLDGRDLVLGPNGELEIIASAKKQPGNWLPMKPETTSLIVRMTFHDREKEIPAKLKIERIGGEGAPAIDPETFEDALQRSLSFVNRTAKLFVDWMNAYSAHENGLPSDDQ